MTMNYNGARMLPVQQLQERSSPLGGMLGKAAGTAVGGALGAGLGPMGAKLGAQAGGALGGQLGGTGNVNPMQAGAQVLGQNEKGVTDWMRGQIGFANGGEIKPEHKFLGGILGAVDKATRAADFASGIGKLFSDRNDKLKGKKKKDKTQKKNKGGPIAPQDTVVDGKFMSMHAPNFSEKVGPLAKTSYKSKGGEVWERQYHNPLMPKPSSGGDKK